MKWPRVPQWVYSSLFIIIAYSTLISCVAWKSLASFPLTLWLFIFIFTALIQIGVKMINIARKSEGYIERAFLVGFGYGMGFLPTTHITDIRNSLQSGIGILYSFEGSARMHIYSLGFTFILSVLVGLFSGLKKPEAR